MGRISDNIIWYLRNKIKEASVIGRLFALVRI